MPPFKKSGSRGSRGAPQQPPEAHQINSRIKVPQVRFVSEDGENVGILPLREALARAEETGMDLVMVSPNATPPVCRVMDYGKFKYEVQKRETKARKNAVQSATKELRVRYSTDAADLETKLKHARTFLEQGDKVKFSMRFRGREIVYARMGNQKFDELIAKLADVGVVEERSGPQGRQIFVVLAPHKDH